MATLKGKLKQKTGASTSDVLHPETEAGIVTYSDSSTSLGASNVQTAIEKLNTKVDNLDTGVTGVKGDKESSYRAGNVNITPANVGALPEAGKTGMTAKFQVGTSAGIELTGGSLVEIASTGSDVVISGSSNSNVYIGNNTSVNNRVATKSDIDNVISIAEGKTTSYVVSSKLNSSELTSFVNGTGNKCYTINGTDVTNIVKANASSLANGILYDASKAAVQVSNGFLITNVTPANATTLQNTSVIVIGFIKANNITSLPKKGDIVYVVEDSPIPDRWVGAADSNVIDFYAIEGKTDLSGYVTTSTFNSALAGKVDKVSGSSLVPDTKVASYDSHLNNTSNPHGVTKSQVGLGSVVNKGMDASPIQNSDNYVKSGGVYSALAGKQNTLTQGNGIAINNDVISINNSTTAGTYSVVTVTAQGLVTAGAQIIQTLNKNDSATVKAQKIAALATNGWYFEEDA